MLRYDIAYLESLFTAVVRAQERRRKTRHDLAALLQSRGRWLIAARLAYPATDDAEIAEGLPSVDLQTTPVLTADDGVSQLHAGVIEIAATFRLHGVQPSDPDKTVDSDEAVLATCEEIADALQEAYAADELFLCAERRLRRVVDHVARA